MDQDQIRTWTIAIVAGVTVATVAVSTLAKVTAKPGAARVPARGWRRKRQG